MTEELNSPKPQAAKLRIEEVIPDVNQPRKSMALNGLKSLAESITGTGQVNPIVVRPGAAGTYMIVTGERRWRAAKEAGLTEIDCIIRYDVDNRKALEMQLAENCQREDVPPLEQAKAYKDYLDKYNASQNELAKRIGIPQRTISARLALLSLPISMHAKIEAGEIGPYEALKISELPPDQQEAVAEAVASDRIGGRILEMLVGEARTHPEKPIELIIEKLTLAQGSPASSGDIVNADMPVAVTATRDNDSSPAETINRETKKDIALKNKPALTKLLLQISTLLDIANEVGRLRQHYCPHIDEEGVCPCWGGESEEEIPKAMGEPVNRGDDWCVKPSILLCAICTDEILCRLDELSSEVAENPLSELGDNFKCSCGSSGEIAVRVKCTKCSRETWWGWWPKES